MVRTIGSWSRRWYKSPIPNTFIKFPKPTLEGSKARILTYRKVLIFGMAATILAGVAQHALGYPTPKPEPGREAIATSPQQTVTRKVSSEVLLSQWRCIWLPNYVCKILH